MNPRAACRSAWPGCSGSSEGPGGPTRIAGLPAAAGAAAADLRPSRFQVARPQPATLGSTHRRVLRSLRLAVPPGRLPPGSDPSPSDTILMLG